MIKKKKKDKIDILIRVMNSDNLSVWVSRTMDGIKQKSRTRRRKKRIQRHKRSILGISAVILLLVSVLSVNGISLRAKDKEYQAQEAELKTRLQEEKDRTEEIDNLESYVSTNEYIEQVAKEKLGLVYSNEIIFKAK